MNDELKNLMNDPKVKNAYDNLDTKKKEQLNSILNNEQELNRLLNTPQAQLLLKKLMEK